MIVLGVTWLAKPGHEADAERILRVLTEESRKEPGCLMYQVHRHQSEPGRFFIYEQYKDEAALQAHRDSAHFEQWAKQELPKMGERVEGNLYDPIED